MKKLIYLTSALLFLGYATGIAQLRPFPQNVDYSYGVKPTRLTVNVGEEYLRWRGQLVVSCGENVRVTGESYGETRVEAIGFGMIASAYYGDKQTFDGLFNFYRSKRSPEAHGMMAWRVPCSGYFTTDPGSLGSATDGDIDVAFGLILAHNQWGGSYLDSARRVIQIIKTNVMIDCGTLKALAPGYNSVRWGGCSLTDIQYYTPAFFRIFAQVTNDDDWNQLADDTYTILNNSANATTGLVPDWQSVSGTPSGDPPNPSSWRGYYAYDACRVPWRIALDYLWNGNTQAKDWCTKVTTWANGVGASNIRDGYNLDGTPNNNGNQNSAFVGGFAVGAMCNNVVVANNFAQVMNTLTNESNFFSLSTRIMYLFAMSGNFWKPESVTGIKEMYTFGHVAIFPNPSINGEFSINPGKEMKSSDRVSITISDIQGKTVYSETISNPSGILTINSGLKSGIYIITLKGDNYIAKEKLIIE